MCVINTTLIHTMHTPPHTPSRIHTQITTCTKEAFRELSNPTVAFYADDTDDEGFKGRILRPLRNLLRLAVGGGRKTSGKARSSTATSSSSLGRGGARGRSSTRSGDSKRGGRSNSQSGGDSSRRASRSKSVNKRNRSTVAAPDVGTSQMILRNSRSNNGSTLNSTSPNAPNLSHNYKNFLSSLA